MPGYDLPSNYWCHKEPFELEGKEILPDFRLAYETWGELNEARDNAVVVLHALSGSSHAFSSPRQPGPGWWEEMLREDSPIHPRRAFVLCANLLGGCYGSTGPSSVDPRTSTRFAIRFPQVTTGDMIETQRALLKGLGVDQPVTLIGGSLGGMLALEWSVRHPEEVKLAIPMVAPGRSYAQAIAFRAVQREAVMADPAWNGGCYQDGPFPEKGIALARKIGMITYRSAREFELRFQRQVRDQRPHFLHGEFEIQSYLNHQGKKFAERFDPNTYLYFSRAMDLYDLGKDHGSLEAALANVQARVLLFAVDSDILCPVEEVEEVHRGLRQAGKDANLVILKSVHGHDSFLIEVQQITAALREFA